MINEEVTKETGEILKQTVVYIIRANKELNQIQKALEVKLLSDWNKAKSNLSFAKKNQVPLKTLYKKGQLEQIDVNKSDLKSLKKDLNRYGVNFSVMKDRETKDYVLFFQAKDTKIMEKAFKNTIFKGKEKEKPSTLETIKKYKEMSMQKDIAKVKEQTKHKVKATTKAMNREI